MSVPRLKLSWPAWRDLCEKAWDDTRELGGVALGRVLPNGDVLIETCVQNPGGPQQQDATSIEFDLIRGRERPASLENPSELRVVGDFHSHPCGSTRASEEDFQIWTRAATTLRQSFAGLIVLPVEGWWAGYPELDWSEPQLRGWVADEEGSLWSTPIIREPKWLWSLEQEMQVAKDNANG